MSVCIVLVLCIQYVSQLFSSTSFSFYPKKHDIVSSLHKTMPHICNGWLNYICIIGPDGSSSQLGFWSGSYWSGTVVSSGRYLYVYFRSDGRNSGARVTFGYHHHPTGNQNTYNTTIYPKIIKRHSRYRNNMINFHPYPHNRHLISRPHGMPFVS